MTPPAGFEEFVRAHQAMVYTTALRLLSDPGSAEDVAQETFLKAWENFAELRGYDSPGGWLKTVARNLALNLLTRDRARWRPVEAAEELPDRAAEVPASMERAQGRAALSRALEALPAHQRVPLVLFHFHDMSYEEIAGSLGATLSKVKTDIFRAREALRRALEGGAE